MIGLATAAAAVGVAIGSTPSAVSGSVSKAVARAASRCASVPAPTLQGSPSHSLLSILSVLRQPSGPRDLLPPGLIQGFALDGPVEHRQVFVNYIRLVDNQHGSGYFIVPTLFTPCTGLMKPVEGIAIYGPGGGGGRATAVQIEARGASGWYDGDRIHYLLVPDGVAVVELRSGAFSATHRVADNFVVFTLPRLLASPLITIWRGANGRTLKTFSGS